MGWFQRIRDRRNRRLALEEDRLERLEARRRAFREVDQIGSIASASEALGKALGQTFSMQQVLLESTGKFLAAMQELSAKKAAQVMGARGGAKRAANMKKAKITGPPSCPLCVNPNHRPVTVAMVTAHSEHEAVAAAQAANQNGAG